MGACFSQKVQKILLQGEQFDQQRIHLTIPFRKVQFSPHGVLDFDFILPDLPICWLRLLEECNCFEYLTKSSASLFPNRYEVVWGGKDNFEFQIWSGQENSRDCGYTTRQMAFMLYFIYLYCSYFPVISVMPIHFILENMREDLSIASIITDQLALLDSVFPLRNLGYLYNWVKDLDDKLSNISSISNLFPKDLLNELIEQNFFSEKFPIHYFSHQLTPNAFVKLFIKAAVAYNMFTNFEDQDEKVLNIYRLFQKEEVHGLWKQVRSQICDSRVEKLFMLDRHTNYNHSSDRYGGFSARKFEASTRNVVFVLDIMNKIVLPADEFWMAMMAYPMYEAPQHKLLPMDGLVLHKMEEDFKKVQFNPLTVSDVKVDSFNVIIYRKLQACNFL